MMKTINCRDDSLFEDRGMWTSMKKKKRCIVVAQGFYEWLKKNNGKEKIPHFTKRKDGQMMCFAGLWDCVQYEGRFRFVRSELLQASNWSCAHSRHWYSGSLSCRTFQTTNSS
jgi:putative SOS response-associated peptidase YedK